MALILLTDQYSRNIFRGTKEAFSSDPTAQKVAGIIYGDPALWSQYGTYEKMFICMPFMHAEDAKLTQQCRDGFKRIADDATNEGLKECAEDIMKWMKFADDHHDIVAKWGRYPHRNAAIGRKTTPEEEEYLKTANTYGQ